MVTFADRMQLGFFPLQDYAAADDGTPLGVRQSLAGGRITRMTDPSRATSAAQTWIEYGKENGMGTLGDVHPWLFWQTAQRNRRATGLWTQVVPALVSDADAYYGTVYALPIRNRLYETDTRMQELRLDWPIGMSTVPAGAMVTVLAGTEEDRQHTLAVWTDPRLIAPSADGPGTAGTLVCDLGPSGEICMGGSTSPGVGGRAGRLQSLVRVIAVAPGETFGGLGSPGNVLALNYAQAEADGLPGYGAVYGFVDNRGPTTPSGPNGPTTLTSSRIVAGGGGAPIGVQPSAQPGMSDPQVDHVERGHTLEGVNQGFGDFLLQDGPQTRAPHMFGQFEARPSQHAVATMAAFGGWGPIHLGSRADKHQHGVDADGHPINAAHLSVNAYWFDSPERDAPMEFSRITYPQPPGNPLTTRVNLSYDLQSQHVWRSGGAQGLWRWWAEVPFQVPLTPGGGGGGGNGGGGRGPGGPGGPGAPPTGGPGGGRGNGPGGPGGPPTGPRGDKKQDTPKTPSGPGGPPNGQGGKWGKGPGGWRWWLPPWWPGPFPIWFPPIKWDLGGGGPRGPRGPRGPAGPPGPPGPAGGPTAPATGPRGKSYPQGGGGNEPGGNEPTTPGGGQTDPGGQGPGICTGPQREPTTSYPFPIEDAVPGGIPPDRPMGIPGMQDDGPVRQYRNRMDTGAASTQARGAGYGGTRAVDPRSQLGRLSGWNPWTGEREVIPGVVEAVGGIDTETRNLWAVHHPFTNSFAAMSFRPQLWVRGYPRVESNPQLTQEMLYADEERRPNVLAAHAWGAQSDAVGDWSYVDDPEASRLRGGTGHGGLMLHPPRHAMEDYFGIGSGDVEDTTSSRATTHYLLAAPGVSYALGTPTTSGGLGPNAVTISRDPTVATKPLVVQHDSLDILRGYSGSGEVTVEIGRGGTTGIRIPTGTTAQRPATPAAGHLRINTSGAADALEWWDSTGSAWVQAGTGSGSGTVDIYDTGVLVGSRPAINFQKGGDLTLVTVDDPVNNRVQVTYSRIKTPAETALAATSVSTDTLPYYDSGTTAATTTLTTFARSILDDTTAAAVRTTIGVDPDYIRKDGTVAFTAPIAGVTPVGLNDLVTKTYVDTADLNLFVYHSNASNLSSGTVPTARLATGTANSSTYLRGDQTWATVPGDDIQHAVATIGTTALGTGYTSIGSKTLTVADGDTIEIQCSGALENNSGTARTFRWRLTVTQGANVENIDLQDGATVATSATNKAAWFLMARSSINTSRMHTTMQSSRSAPAANNVSANTSGATIRMVWAQDANDYTGTTTFDLQASVTAGTADIYVGSFQVQQTPNRP